ncbi:MAG: LuxR C-terminal-related transcriptional regulator [Frankiaceae bacterium]
MNGPRFVPLESNLRRPALRDGVIIRGELVDTLRERTEVPVVAISGPPGYGKTTLLVQWSIEDQRPFAWLTVDRAANNPVALATYMMLALQQLGDVDHRALSALGDESSVSAVLLPRLGRMLAEIPRPFVLVVDDAGLLTSPATVPVLMTVARHLGDGSQLVVAGRTIPRLPLSKLRAERHLLAIGQDDLRFSTSEAAGVLAAAEVELPGEDMQALVSRTEGWPAAVHLAALGLGQVSHQRSERSALGVGDQVVADYLRREILATVPPDQVQFLVRTSILTKLCVELCDAVIGISGSANSLRELARANLFVVPLDSQEHWYRYHGLFRRVLQQVVEEDDPRLVAQLHSRASRWLEAAGYVEEAIQHAQAAHDVARAARLVWSQTAALVASGRSQTLRRWLDGFSNEQVVGHAKLCLTAAWCALENGRPVDHWIDAAERGLFDATQPGELASIQAAITLLHAERARDGMAAMRAHAERAMELQAPDDLWRPFAEYLQAVAALLTGAPEEARRRLAATQHLAADLALHSHQALCLAQLAAMAIEAGDWIESAALVDAACDVLVEKDIADSPLISLVHCVATVMLAKRGRTDQAKQLARRAMRMIAVINQCPPWLAVQARYLLGRAHLLMGDTAAARVLLSEAQRYLHGVPDAMWLREGLDQAWTHVERFPLATGVGPSALTSAELRILQLLPTYLSFEQIGRRLLISRNTVKTQAIATYRKLGVASRGEAVERARSLGMIQM